MDDKLRYRFDVIEEKIDKLTMMNEEQIKVLHKHDIQLVEYNALLDKHIEGVEQNRAAIKEVKVELRAHEVENHTDLEGLKAEIEPLLIHDKVVQYMKNGVIAVGSIIGAVLTILKIMGKV